MNIEEFNQAHELGKSVAFTENGKIIIANLRWPAETLPDTEREVIWVHDRANAVDLKDVIF